MKTIEIGAATGPLADSIRRARGEPLVVTEDGAPTAVVLPLGNADLETVALSTDPGFLALIERSRSRIDAEGPLSAAEMRRRVFPGS